MFERGLSLGICAELVNRIIDPAGPLKVCVHVIIKQNIQHLTGQIATLG